MAAVIMMTHDNEQASRLAYPLRVIKDSAIRRIINLKFPVVLPRGLRVV